MTPTHLERNIEKRTSLIARTVSRRWIGTLRFTKCRPGGIPTAQVTVARELHECCRETAQATHSSARLPHAEAHKSWSGVTIDLQVTAPLRHLRRRNVKSPQPMTGRRRDDSTRSLTKVRNCERHAASRLMSAMIIGPEENFPSAAFAVRVRRYPPGE